MINESIVKFMDEIVNECSNDMKIVKSYSIHLETDEQTLILKHKSRNEHNNIALDNFFLRYKQGENIKSILKTLKGMLFEETSPLELLRAWESVKDRVFPQIKAISYISDTLVHTPFCKGATASIAYVVDFEDKMLYVTNNMMKEWDVSVETIHEQSMSNLKNIMVFPVKMGTQNNYIYGFETGDGYDATRALILDFEELEGNFKGDICIVMPNRDCLIVFDEKMPFKERIINQAKLDYIRQPYAISNQAFVRRNGVWKVLA